MLNGEPALVLDCTRRPIRVPRIALVSLCALLTTCSNEGPTNPANDGPCPLPGSGSFTGNVTGAVSAQLGGCVFYSIFGSGTDQIRVIGLLNFALATSASLTVRRQGSRPAEDTYDVQTPGSASPGDFTGSIIFTPGGRSFVFTSGSVTINASENALLRGSLTAIGVESATADSVTVTATFTAKCSSSSPSC